MNHRRKSMLSLLLALVLLTSLLPAQAADTAPTEMQSGDLAAEKPSIADIQAKYATVTTAETRFDAEPSVTSPYALGELSPSFLDSGLTYFNYIRYLAGLPAVELSEEKNTAAQYGAVVMAANNELAHFPTQPEDMDDAFYQAGYAATSTSNLSMRGTSSAGNLQLDVLQSAIAGQMSDSGSNNLSTLGHRRWLLSPRLLYTGFGCADAEFDGTFYRTYVDVPVFDRSGSAVDYDFVAWPASGYMPVQEFAIGNPWSVSLNPTKYATPALEDLSVTLTRVVDGKSCVFTSDTCPETPAEDGSYFTIDTRGYGEGAAIIFRPASDDFGSTQYGLGAYTVTVAGLQDRSGNAETLSYRVVFFDIEIGSAGQDIPSCSVYLSADGTDWVSEGLTCAYDGTAKEPLVIVCSDETKLTQGVDYTVTYEDNVEQGIASVVITGTGQYSGVKRVSFEINDPSHPHEFGSPTFIWSADNSACTAAFTCSICGIVQMRPCTVTRTVEPATCTERGSEQITASVTVGIRTYRTSKWKQLAALGHDWDSGVITTPATETEAGVKTYTCTRCEETKTESIPKLEHTHSYTAEVTEPTCTEQGYTTYTCACGYSYRDNYTTALGHSFGAWTVSKKATCTEAGKESRTCSRCGTTETRIIPALGHNWDDGVVTTAPTATADGVKTYTCTVCKATKTEVIPATGLCDGGATCPSRGLSDVKTHWGHPSIDYCVENGLMNGVGDGKFNPDGTVTRAMLATVLYRQAGSPDVQNASAFPDVNPGEWYGKAIAWAADAGIVTGYPDGTFDPNKAVTRQELATMFYRYAKFAKFDVSAAGDLSVFPDRNQVLEYAMEAMVWANGAGLITGNVVNDVTCLDPKGNATRSQLATILMRFCENIAS
ncbi:MAG: S-layer homology domain-containing protein [Clostridiales bacterium]|nr:S-layer homology domain-containing protein [Clostridiales bacterium]MDD6935637.1 S-layer homology domain-containing protein [Clostridiales bacterium]MDY2961473.1 S-layer homology domain-containing protein [Oscillospiraceae bacterium]